MFGACPIRPLALALQAMATAASPVAAEDLATSDPAAAAAPAEAGARGSFEVLREADLVVAPLRLT